MTDPNPRAPVVKFVHADINGKRTVIRYEQCTKQFVLFFGTEIAAECAHPRPLATYALDAGSIDVRHEYDPTAIFEDY